MKLMEARKILENVTPMKSDCGRLCGAACCCSLEAEETGMLLFPGEEEMNLPEGSRIIGDEKRRLLVCSGTCERELRPLSCRMFTLLPTESGVEVDARARAICPLAGEGLDAFAPSFVEAVAEAG